MSKAKRAHKHVPAGWHTVTPRIFVKDAKRLIAFLKKTFDAEGDYDRERPSQLRIGDSILMINDTGVRSATRACFYVYVANVDATYRKAMKARARSIEKPVLTEYGDRRCIVKDRWENTWQIATHFGRARTT